MPTLPPMSGYWIMLTAFSMPHAVLARAVSGFLEPENIQPCSVTFTSRASLAAVTGVIIEGYIPPTPEAFEDPSVPALFARDAAAAWGRLIAAIEETGWRHDTYPELTITGEVDIAPAVYTFTSLKPVQPEVRCLAYQRANVKLNLLAPLEDDRG